MAEAETPLSTGEGGSSSASESSPSDNAPTVEGLLEGESGLSGTALAVGTCRLISLGIILTGDGRRS